MSDDAGVIDKGWDALPAYTEKPGEPEDAVTVSISTAPGEWLVNTNDAVVVPMSMVEVVEALRSHRLNERSLVWRAGMQEWAAVEKVPQLKLAARLPSVVPKPERASTPAPPEPSAPLRSAPTASRTPVPMRPSTPSVTGTPLPAPPVVTPAARVLPSRRATLPFGLPPPPSSPEARPSRPALRPASPPPALDDSEVLAVYDRPAATISFELSSEESEPRYVAPATRQPQTLAPTTTDSAPLRAPTTSLRSSDPSVVPARDLRRAQDFSKKLILASSVGSALVASLLTLWLSRGDAQRAAASAPMPAQALPTAPSTAPLVTPPPAVTPAPASVATTEALAEEPPKPKAKRKPRALRAPVKTPPPSLTAPVDDANTAEPAAPKPETNPYDVRLEEDPPAAKPPSPSHGSGLEPESGASTEAAPSSPGF